MMRFYPGLSDRDCLAMPMSRLLLLFDQITTLQTEEEIRDIVIAHCGDPQQRVTDLQERLYASGKAIIAAPPTPVESKAGFVDTLDVEAFNALRERQQAAHERLRAEHAAAHDGA